MLGQTKGRSKSPLKAFMWLLLIPGQLILAAAFMALGTWMDAGLFSHKAENVTGHGMPVFSMIFGIIAVIVTVVVIILAVILTIAGVIRICRNNKSVGES